MTTLSSVAINELTEHVRIYAYSMQIRHLRGSMYIYKQLISLERGMLLCKRVTRQVIFLHA